MTVYLPVSASEHIYQGVRQMILRGELRPGQRVVQRTLAERFGTSNIPVIEAIRRLEQDGLLVSRPNAGAQVPDWSRDEVLGAFLTREALEGVAARLFTQHASPAAEKQLQEHEAQFRRGVLHNDRELFSEADMALHTAMVAACGVRPLLRAFLSSATLVVTMAKTEFGPHGEPGFVPAADAHAGLMQALLSRDGAVAEQAARLHVHQAMETWAAFQAPGQAPGQARNLGSPLKA